MSVAGPLPRAAAPGLPPWAVAAVAAVVLVQGALFAWMAPRGFDISDESFYFLHYLHWRELTATTTFFGGVFAGPYAVLGQSIAGIRLLGLLIVLAGSAYLVHEVIRRAGAGAEGGSRGVQLAFVLAGMAGGMLYYGYLSTLRAPSYNLQALGAAAAATGLLLRLTGEPPGAAGHAGRPALAVLYGALMALCALGKPTSAALLAVVHLGFVATLGAGWLRRQLLPMAGLSMLGVAVVFGVLQLVHPGWLPAVRESLALVSATDGRSVTSLAKGVVWELQRLPAGLWLAALGIGAAALLLRRAGGRVWPGAAAIALVALCVGWIATDQDPRLWLPLAALATLGLLVVARAGLRDATLALMLLAVPVALSFGTNMPVLSHSQINAAFAWAALLGALVALQRQGRTHPAVLGACLLMLCVPGLLTQTRAATDVSHTYRQTQALGAQQVPVSVGPGDSMLLVSPDMAASLQALTQAAQAAGWPGRGPMLDVTGDGPGWMFALGGQPLGTPWLLGGYPGSEAAVALLLRRLPEAAIRDAWLLSSTNAARRIQTWPQPLAERLGPGSHVLVATVSVHAPYRWGRGAQPERIELQLWRPAAAPRAP